MNTDFYRGHGSCWRRLWDIKTVAGHWPMLSCSWEIRQQTVWVFFTNGQVMGPLNTTTGTDIANMSVSWEAVCTMCADIWRVCAWKCSRLWPRRRLQTIITFIDSNWNWNPTAHLEFPKLESWSQDVMTPYFQSTGLSLKTRSPGPVNCIRYLKNPCYSNSASEYSIVVIWSGDLTEVR